MTNQDNFRRVGSVAIPVSDQDRSVAFFKGLGFEVVFDAALRDDFRWVEVSPEEGGCKIALVQTDDELPTGIDTGIRLFVTDAKAAHQDLADAGATVGTLLEWPGVPPMFRFSDLDGNRLYVTQA
jgi:catechol 2,3-dioxygenase-like lactoylglutathione lyase family enzyme